MGKITYIPANMPGGPIMNNYKRFGHVISWWNENSFFKYDKLLVSAYFGFNYPSFREYYKIPKDVIVYGDSGGFQNLTMNANLDPIKVLRWQEKNCDVGFTFDFPLIEKNKTIRYGKMVKTAINSEIAYNKKENKDMKLYACFHGQSNKEQLFMIEEYEKRIGLEKFDGIAYGGLVESAGNITHLVKILALFCYNVKRFNKPVHFFGLSGERIMKCIKYISDKFDMDISFDSTSYTSGARRREFWLLEEKKKIKTMSVMLDKMPCDCPVCSVVSDWKEYTKDKGLGGTLISLHNLHQTIQYVEKLKQKEVKLNHNYERFIDIMFEHGPNKAFQILDKLPEYEYEQPNLFEF